MVLLLLNTLLALALHESGHALATWTKGLKVKKIGLSLRGLYIVRESGTPSVNLFITLAGPAVNLVLTLWWPMAPDFARVNLILGLYNLMPFLAGSDGQRAWVIAAAMLRTDAQNQRPAPHLAVG